MQNQPEIKWTKHACATDSDVLIEVSTQRLVDALRASDPGTYVALGDPVNPTLEDRYERIGEAIAAGHKMEPPIIGLDDDDRVGIADGRHRIAWCRDHGVLRITVLVNKDDAPGLLDLIG